MPDLDPKDLPDMIMSHPKVLERRRLASMSYVSRHATIDIADHILPDLYDMLMVRMESEVLGEKLVEETRTFPAIQFHPSSPWQFFKQRHADSWWLRWLVRRRPVQQTRHEQTLTVDFTRYANYPMATIDSPPSLGTPVIWEQATGHVS